MLAGFQAKGVSRSTMNATPEIEADTLSPRNRAIAVVVRNMRLVHFIHERAPFYRRFTRFDPLRLAVEVPSMGNYREASGQGASSL